MKEVNIGKIKLGAQHPLVLIAGPCVLEGQKLVLEIAAELKRISTRWKIPLIFKASYDKANRSSARAYRGVGIKKGLEILSRVRESTGLPVLSDVHSREEVKPASEVLNVIQIPAFLCRQTDLLVEAGRSGLPVNIKKGQFLSPAEMKEVALKISSTGNRKIILTERGTFFGYHNLVVDFRSLVMMKKLGYPVCYDATHSVQTPGEHGTSSGGRPEFIFPLARAAAAVGISALFLEVHPRPARARCDRANCLSLSGLEQIIPLIMKIDRLTKSSQPREKK